MNGAINWQGHKVYGFKNVESVVEGQTIMTTTATKLSHAQMIRLAESDLAGLDKQELESVAKIKACEAELATLESRKESRAAQLATMEETCKHLRGQHATLVESARLAQGGLQQGHFVNKVRAAEKEKSKAEKALASEEDTARKATAEDYTRLLTCSAEKAAAARSIHDIHERRTALTAAVAAIREEQGQEAYRDLVFQVELLLSSIEAKRRDLADEERALDSVLDVGITGLKDWPEKQEQARRLVPFEDDATVLMEQATHYLDALATRIGSISTGINGAHWHEPEIAYTILADLLQVSPADLGRGGVYQLKEQSRKTRLFLAAYRRAKREG